MWKSKIIFKVCKCTDSNWKKPNQCNVNMNLDVAANTWLRLLGIDESTRYYKSTGNYWAPLKRTGGPGRPCRPVNPRCPFCPLSPWSPRSPLSPLGPCGPWNIFKKMPHYIVTHWWNIAWFSFYSTAEHSPLILSCRRHQVARRVLWSPASKSTLERALRNQIGLAALRG